MQQQISLITLGVADLGRSKRFYGEGFSWKPVFETPGIVFYQMNGMVLGLWPTSDLEADMQRPGLVRPGAFALAHNVAAKEEVQPVLDRLAAAGGRILRPPMSRHMAASAAMSPIPTIMPGRLRGTHPGPSQRMGGSPSASEISFN